MSGKYLLPFASIGKVLSNKTPKIVRIFRNLFSKIIEPRFGNTDALGHINNITIAEWFELARNDLHFQIFEDLSPAKCNLIMAHSSYDFLHETFYGKNVEVKTHVSRIGNKSFELTHELWQDGIKTASGKVVIVHYVFASKTTMPLTDKMVNLLSEHLAEQA